MRLSSSTKAAKSARSPRSTISRRGRWEEISATASDGYPVHGWIVRPEGAGPHPVLFNIHGGPFAQYGHVLFDEAQVYAGAGYAVVMGNPRGSAGYGEKHSRAVVGAMGTVDVDDLMVVARTPPSMSPISTATESA